MPDSEHVDFQLEIGAGRGRRYPVEVLSSPAGEAHETIHFPFDEATLEKHIANLHEALIRFPLPTLRAPLPEDLTVRDFGRSLFDSLFSGAVRTAYDESLFSARQQGKRLRLRLRIEDPALASLPWEFLYDSRSGEYLCLSRNICLVRFLDVLEPNRPVLVNPPLRVLAVTASPHDAPALDAAAERSRLETALARLVAAGLVEISWLDGSGWRELQRALRSGPWHVLHFIGHGAFATAIDEGLLVLVAEDGSSQLMPASHVGRLLADHPSVRLVVLAACQGAEGSRANRFSSAAAALVRRGLPAVVAMQSEVTDLAAMEFSRGLYEALADGLPVDAAVAEARIGVSLAVGGTLEWGTPLLFMRSPDGLLFEMADRTNPALNPAGPAVLSPERATQQTPEAATERIGKAPQPMPLLRGASPSPHATKAADPPQAPKGEAAPTEITVRRDLEGTVRLVGVAIAGVLCAVGVALVAERHMRDRGNAGPRRGASRPRRGLIVHALLSVAWGEPPKRSQRWSQDRSAHSGHDG